MQEMVRPNSSAMARSRSAASCAGSRLVCRTRALPLCSGVRTSVPPMPRNQFAQRPPWGPCSAPDVDAAQQCDIAGGAGLPRHIGHATGRPATPGRTATVFRGGRHEFHEAGESCAMSFVRRTDGPRERFGSPGLATFAAMSTRHQRPVVTELRLSAFKSHRGATFGLGPLTLLTGGSGTGKSSVLEGLAALGRLACGGDARGGVRPAVRGGAAACVPQGAQPDAQGRRGFRIGCTVDRARSGRSGWTWRCRRSRPCGSSANGSPARARRC